MFDEYPPFLSVSQCCEILSVEKHAIYQLIESKQLDAIRPNGKLWRVSKKSIILFVLRESGIEVDEETIYDYI